MGVTDGQGTTLAATQAIRGALLFAEFQKVLNSLLVVQERTK